MDNRQNMTAERICETEKKIEFVELSNWSINNTKDQDIAGIFHSNSDGNIGGDPLSDRTRSTSTCLDTPKNEENFNEFNMKKIVGEPDDIHTEIRRILTMEKLRIAKLGYNKILSHLTVMKEGWKNRREFYDYIAN